MNQIPQTVLPSLSIKEINIKLETIKQQCRQEMKIRAEEKVQYYIKLYNSL